MTKKGFVDYFKWNFNERRTLEEGNRPYSADGSSSTQSLITEWPHHVTGVTMTCKGSDDVIQ
jgi:hypothetical protein